MMNGRQAHLAGSTNESCEYLGLLLQCIGGMSCNAKGWLGHGDLDGAKTIPYLLPPNDRGFKTRPSLGER